MFEDDELDDQEEIKAVMATAKELSFLWRFVDAYDAWAQDDDDDSEPFSGPKFHTMVEARAVLEDKYGI